MISSPLKTLIAKSSEPAINSSCPSPSKSKNSSALTLSPLTVQNRSSPSKSNPVILQLPPTITTGYPTSWKKSYFETWIVVSPSFTSFSKTSELFRQSYSKRFVLLPIISKSRPGYLGSSAPLNKALICLFVFRY